MFVNILPTRLALGIWGETDLAVIGGIEYLAWLWLSPRCLRTPIGQPPTPGGRRSLLLWSRSCSARWPSCGVSWPSCDKRLATGRACLPRRSGRTRNCSKKSTSFAPRTDNSRTNFTEPSPKRSLRKIDRINWKTPANLTPGRNDLVAINGASPSAKRRDHSHLPVVEERIELPRNQCLCPQCGKLREEMTETEDSELIEIDVRAYRRRIRRQRYRATCDCAEIPRTLTAPAAPKLIPKGRYGISLWVHVLLDKFASHRATTHLIEQLKLYDLALPPGTVTQGLKRLAPLLDPIYQALLERNGRSVYRQADETRWPVFVEVEGKQGHRWWLWAPLGEETVVFRIAMSRGHEVPEEHYPEDLRAFLMVDRYSAYKAMAQVKSGVVVLAFCWAHVRRDFIAVGKGWPELVDWALAWLQRIREIYRLNRERLRHDSQTSAFEEHDTALRAAIAAMDQQAAHELADPNLRQPCRKALKSLRSHWSGLTLFVDDPKIPLDNNASERIVRGPAMGRKNYYGSHLVVERRSGGEHVFDRGHAEAMELESTSFA